MESAVMGHLFGDYILQNDVLASNKKSSTFYCSIHCFIWAACVVAFAQWPLWTFVPLFITHFIQDRTNIIKWWMGVVGQKSFCDRCDWSVIVVDNIWHLFVIWIVWKSI